MTTNSVTMTNKNESMDVFAYRVNAYNDAEVTDLRLRGGTRGSSICVDEFEELLWRSLNFWQKEKRNAVWLRIGAQLAEFIPVATRHGFQFHSCEPSGVTLTLFLGREIDNRLPPGPRHFIGVAGFVMNSKQEVLCVREKTGPSARLDEFWKLPGGLVDPHENIQSAVVREVKEETGIDATFSQIAALREAHHTEAYGGLARAGTSDIYIVCILKLNDEAQPIRYQEEEIADCKWIPLSQLMSLKYYNRPGTLYHKLFSCAASVALGSQEGLAAGLVKTGSKQMETSVYFPRSKM